jgi:hypothetical protein
MASVVIVCCFWVVYISYVGQVKLAGTVASTEILGG